MTIAQHAQANIDDVVARSLIGEGALSSHFGIVKQSYIEQERNNNSLRDVKLSDEEIEKRAAEKLKSYSEELKPLLTKTANGESVTAEQGMDLQKIAGMAGTIGSASSAFNSGNIFSFLSFIPAIMSSFGDYIGAFFESMSGKKSFSEALADNKAKKAIPEFASTLKGVDSNRLMSELTKEPVKLVELDDAFNEQKKQEILSSTDTAFAQVQENIKNGNIRIQNGKGVAVEGAVTLLDALSKPPANTPQQPNSASKLNGMKDKSWAAGQ